MPSLWKKAKVNRISRLVADLHQSPKRGGSLVVETGFPTSLIDLFVKNQDRLRKSCRRKSGAGPQVPPSFHSPPKSFPSSPPCVQEVVRSPDTAVGESVLVERVRAECEERVAIHPAFQVFLVVALAVGTPTLAVWIMMASFLLVLLEFFGFFRPQSLMLFLGSWLQKGLSVLKKRWDLDWEQPSQPSQPQSVAKQQQQQQQQGSVFSDSCGGDDCVEEIQIAESIDEGCERISEILKKNSEVSIRKRDRIKENLIRKFVPKKLRKRKQWKKNKDQEEEPCSGLQSGVDISLDQLNTIEQIEVEIEIEIEEEAEAESCIQEVEGSVQVKSGSEYVILILLGIVLSGLLGGRGVSLLLTLVCCLVARLRYSSSIRFGFGWFRLNKVNKVAKKLLRVNGKKWADHHLDS